MFLRREHAVPALSGEDMAVAESLGEGLGQGFGSDFGADNHLE